MPDTQKWSIFSCFTHFLLRKENVPCSKKCQFSEKGIKNARLATLDGGKQRGQTACQRPKVFSELTHFHKQPIIIITTVFLVAVPFFFSLKAKQTFRMIALNVSESTVRTREGPPFFSFLPFSFACLLPSPPLFLSLSLPSSVRGERERPSVYLLPPLLHGSLHTAGTDRKKAPPPTFVTGVVGYFRAKIVISLALFPLVCERVEISFVLFSVVWRLRWSQKVFHQV